MAAAIRLLSAALLLQSALFGNEVSAADETKTSYEGDEVERQPESPFESVLEERSVKDEDRRADDQERRSGGDSEDDEEGNSTWRRLPEPAATTTQKQRVPAGAILVVALGGGDDESFAAHLSHLLVRHGKKVMALVYGPGPREVPYPPDAQLLQLGVPKGDPLHPDISSTLGITPDEINPAEDLVPGRLLKSREAACRSLATVQGIIAQLSPSLIITPLFLHDACILPLADELKVPVIGVVTSRVGIWWVWTHLGVIPPLSTTAVPFWGALDPTNVWSRMSNMASHYSYISWLQERWQAVIQTNMERVVPLTRLYAGLSRVFVAWDPLVDSMPILRPYAIPAAPLEGSSVEMSKDILVTALLNKAGVIAVSPGGREIWIGRHALDALFNALASLPHTILWQAAHPHLMPNVSGNGDSKFLFKERFPLNAALNHPRHRLLVSTCSESDVGGALHFGSPLLCLPVTPDQLLAAVEVQRLGFGLSLSPRNVRAEELKNALADLTKSRRYRERARKLAEEQHDQPLSPAEHVLFHVEHATRRPRSDRYRIPACDLSFLQRTNADVYLILLSGTTLVVGILVGVAHHFGPILLRKTKMKKE